MTAAQVIAAWAYNNWMRLTTPNSTTNKRMNFPGVLPIKVMGANQEDFESLVVSIIQKHANVLEEEVIINRVSRNGRYISITIQIQAESQDQVDAIYRELSAHERVLMLL